MRFLKMHGANRYVARLLAVATCASVLVLTGVGVQAEVPGTATVSGTVTASESFTAAQVYLRNVDRDMVYMVYTNQGRYRAVALFPGTYEVSASTKHLESDVRSVTLSAGDAGEVDLALGELSGDAPPLVIPAGRTAMESGRAGAFEFASYDEIYPPGPGKEVAEQVCMACHGENFFPTRPGTERQWMSWIDHMVGSTLGEQDPTRYGQGLLSFRASVFRFGRQDRDDLLAYVVKNFGPDSKRRRVRIEQQTPVDEEALGKAMYIEYYLAKDGPGEGVNAEPWARDRVARYGQDPRFDADGNVWLVDRGVPHRLVKLDPRTGEQWEWLYPDPRNGNHEILIDPVRPDLAAGAPRPHRGQGEAAPRVQPRDRGVRVPDSDGPRRRGAQPDEVHAVAGHGLEGQHLRRLDHGRRAEQVGPGDGRGVGVPHPDPACHPLRRRGRPQRQHLDRAVERRQDRSSSTRPTTRGPSSRRPPTRGTRGA